MIIELSPFVHVRFMVYIHASENSLRRDVRNSKFEELSLRVSNGGDKICQ